MEYRLRSVTSLSKADIEAANEVMLSLAARFGNDMRDWRDKCFEPGSYRKVIGYAQYKFYGRLRPGISLTPFELSIIIDRGYSYFGGYIQIGVDGSINAKIYTD